MNSLNSILLEGTVVSEIEVLSSGQIHDEIAHVRFGIESKRHFKKDGAPAVDECIFEVEAHSKLADNCRENLEKGRGVRVVGRISQREVVPERSMPYLKVFIVAEHVDFKPILSTPKKD